MRVEDLGFRVQGRGMSGRIQLPQTLKEDERIDLEWHQLSKHSHLSRLDSPSVSVSSEMHGS